MGDRLTIKKRHAEFISAPHWTGLHFASGNACCKLSLWGAETSSA